MSSTFLIIFIMMTDPVIFVAYMAHLLYIYIRGSHFFWGGSLISS